MNLRKLLGKSKTDGFKVPPTTNFLSESSIPIYMVNFGPLSFRSLYRIVYYCYFKFKSKYIIFEYNNSIIYIRISAFEKRF